MAAQITSTEAQNAFPSYLPLNDRVAIVNCGSRSIGSAIATHLHSFSAKLVINYASSNSTQADQLAFELNSCENTQSKAIAVQADVSNLEQVKQLFDRAKQEFETQAHIVVNCARILDPKYPTLAETSVEDWDKTFSMNAKGTFLVSWEEAATVKKIAEAFPLNRLGEPKDVAPVMGFLTGDMGSVPSNLGLGVRLGGLRWSLFEIERGTFEKAGSLRWGVFCKRMGFVMSWGLIKMKFTQIS